MVSGCSALATAGRPASKGRAAAAASSFATTYALGQAAIAFLAGGSKGKVDLLRCRITGENKWNWDGRCNPYQVEHDELFKSIRSGKPINNGDYMAKSTMMAILARMTAYTGRTLTWEDGMNSQLDLSPSSYQWDADPPPAQVAIPGVTPFV